MRLGNRSRSDVERQPSGQRRRPAHLECHSQREPSRGTGSTWKTEQVPDVNEIGYTRLTAVSCSAASACMAVGTYNGGTEAVSELWNGISRKLYAMPGPPQAEPFVQPAGLSCTQPSFAMRRSRN